MEFIIALALELYKATLQTYPAMTILLSIIFAMLGGVYYFIFKIHPGRTRIFLASFIVKEQMDTADEFLDEIENDMLSMYLRLRKESGVTCGALLDIETKRFQALLKILLHRTKSLVRYFFRENHLTEMTETEFQTHVAERADLILRRLRETYNQWYICGEIPSAEEVYDAFLSEYKHKMRNKLMDIFRDGRIIARNFQDKKFIVKYFKRVV